MTMTNDAILRELAEAEGLPRQALANAVLQVEDLAPRFMELLEKGANGRIDAPGEQNLLFFGVHVLGAARHQAAYPVFMRFLRESSGEDLDFLLGDSITVTLPAVTIGLFDGRSADLFDALARRTDGFVRCSLFGAVAYLTWEGRIDKVETIRFLERFHHEKLAPQDDLAWLGWHDTVGLLGLESLRDRARGLLDENPVLEEFLGPGQLDDFFARAASAAPDDPERFRNEGLHYLDDLVRDLSWIEKRDSLEDEDWDEDTGTPVRNPFRNVGRNDPCPCGSGKKAKKCCLAEAE